MPFVLKSATRHESNRHLDGEFFRLLSVFRHLSVVTRHFYKLMKQMEMQRILSLLVFCLVASAYGSDVVDLSSMKDVLKSDELW